MLIKLFAFVVACLVEPFSKTAAALWEWRFATMDRRRKRRLFAVALREATKRLNASNVRYHYARQAYAMGTKMHTDVTINSPANAAIFNAVFGQLDNALADMELQLGDFVITGGLAGTSASLIISVPACRAYVTNTYAQSGLQNLTVTLNQDTYVDIDNAGLLHMSGVANGAAVPAVFANSIRLFKAVSGATAVTSVVDLRQLNPLTPNGLNVKGPTPWADVVAWQGGTNTADNTAALTAAYNALPAGGGIILAPIGIYNYATALTWSKHIRFLGAGRDLDNSTNPPTVLQYNPAGAGTTALTITSHACVLEGCVVRQGNAQATTRGLVYSGVFNCTTREVTVLSFTGRGVSVLATAGASCIWNRFDQVRVGSCTGGLLVQGDAGSSHTADANAFYNCQILNNGTVDNVTVASFASNNGFRECDFSTCPGGSMVIVGDGTANPCRGNTFDNCYLESTGTTIGFDLRNSCQTVWLRGCHYIATTKVSVTGNANGWQIDGDTGALSSIGAVTGVRIDAAGGISLNSAVQGANTINGPGGWVAMTAGSVLTTFNTSDFTVNKTLIGLKDIRRSRQTPTEAVLVSGVDATAGELISVTLTAARVVGAPLNPAIGQRLTFTLIEGGAGAFAITWNAVFKKTWSDVGNATNARSSISYQYDGTNWNQDGAQAPYV